jgi:hypothetical protein
VAAAAGDDNCEHSPPPPRAAPHLVIAGEGLGRCKPPQCGPHGARLGGHVEAQVQVGLVGVGAVATAKAPDL